MKKFFYIAVFIFATTTVQAQDPHFSQYYASPLVLNPAYSGKFNGVWRLTAIHRDQWPSIPKAYVTTGASIDFAILKNKVPEGDVFGVGISGVSDASANSALKLNYGSVSLSYHKALDENNYNTIGAGFQGTLSTMTLDITKITFEDELQQNGFAQGTSNEYSGTTPLTGKTINPNYFEMNAGLLYSGSSNGQNNYYAGFSIYHVNRPKVSFRDKNWYLSSRITLHGGGTFPISEKADINLSLIHQIQNKASETVFGGAVTMNVNGDREDPVNFHAGSWLRLNDAIIPYLGLEFKGLRIGATYDINISDLKAATGSRGGSEFSLIYIKRPPQSKGIPCPSF